MIFSTGTKRRSYETKTNVVGQKKVVPARTKLSLLSIKGLPTKKIKIMILIYNLVFILIHNLEDGDRNPQLSSHFNSCGKMIDANK
jgi:hypothetical protein